MKLAECLRELAVGKANESSPYKLVKYHTKISSLFRNSRDHSFVIICLDLEIQSLYVKTPFCMDEIHEINAMWMAQLTKPQNISSASHLKRPNSDNLSPSFKKRQANSICLNWNGGSCLIDPCKHN